MGKDKASSCGDGTDSDPGCCLGMGGRVVTDGSVTTGMLPDDASLVGEDGGCRGE